MTREWVEKIETEVSIDYSIGEKIHFSDTDKEAETIVKHPTDTPLTVEEDHASIKIHTDDGLVHLKLDGETLDGMIDALHSVQKFHSGE